jgi:hypothetical protein
MVVLKKILCALFVSLFLSSCLDGIFDTLDRTPDDPFTEIPSVSSFLDSYAIYTSWKTDEAADEYILERSENAIQLSYQVIYKGTKTSFVDRNLPDGSMFLYRLSKRRGKKTFPPSNPALGVSSLTVRDLHEPNDSQELATRLSDITLYANLPFFRAYNGLTISDTDWFYVEIPPLWTASIVIFDQKAIPGSPDTHFMIYFKDAQTPSTVPHNTEITVINYKTVYDKCYFKIYPRETLYTDNFSGGFGGAVIDYTIKIAQLRPW